MPEAPARLHFALALVRDFPHGGVQRFMRRLAAELVRREHRVLHCAEHHEGELPTGVERLTLPVRARGNHVRNARFARRLKDALTARGDIDLVVGATKLPGLDLYYAGDPCYRARIAQRPTAALQRLTPRYRALAAQEEAVFGRGRDTAVMTMAPAGLAAYREVYGTEDERFHILPPGLDRARLEVGRAQPFRPPAGYAAGRPFVLMVGSGFRTKGVDRAIRAFATLDPSVRGERALIVVGEGKVDAYRRLARRLGVGRDVVFAGARPDVVPFYLHADLLLHPARLENAGNVLLESLALGLPVLTVGACGFAPHVAASGGGVVLPEPFRADALAAALAEILNDAEARAQMAAVGPRYTQDTPLEGLIEAAADLAESLARERSPSR